MSKRNIAKYIPLRQTLFLDLLFDRRTRRIFFYVFLMIVVGASLYRWLEGWSWIDSFYFVVVTLTTIGYGDFYADDAPNEIDYNILWSQRCDSSFDVV